MKETRSFKCAPGPIGTPGEILQLSPIESLSSAGAGALQLADGSGMTSFTEGASQDVWYWGRRLNGFRAAGVGAVDAGFSPTSFMFDVRSDTSDCGQAFHVGLESRLIFGGSSVKGGRIGFYGTVNHADGATNGANLNRNYVGVQGSAYAYGYAGLGGDGGSPGNERGAYFGVAGAAYANSLSSYLLDLTGGEYNTFVGAGTVGIKLSSGISVVGCNAARGTTIDCAIRIAGQPGIDSTNTGHIGWSNGITWTDVNGAAPLFSGSALMNSYWSNGGTKPIARGFDLSGFAITNEVLSSGPYMKLYNDHWYIADAQGFAVIEPNGPSANSNLLLRGRGTGFVSVGPWGPAGGPVTGCIYVCDSNGIPRKIATID